MKSSAASNGRVCVRIGLLKPVEAAGIVGMTGTPCAKIGISPGVVVKSSGVPRLHCRDRCLSCRIFSIDSSETVAALRVRPFLWLAGRCLRVNRDVRKSDDAWKSPTLAQSRFLSLACRKTQAFREKNSDGTAGVTAIVGCRV